MNIKDIAITVLLLYLLFNNSCTSINSEIIAGEYILYNDENCPLLGFYKDTMTLKEDGIVLSKNFGDDARYIIENDGILKNKILTISYEYGNASIGLLIEKPLFGEIRLKTCVDMHEYYLKTD